MAKLPMNYDNYVFDCMEHLLIFVQMKILILCGSNLRYSTDTTRHCTHLMS